MDVFLRKLRHRLRRQWVAIRYRYGSFTNQITRKSLILKLATLAVVAYCIIPRSQGELNAMSDENTPMGKSILTESPIAGNASEADADNSGKSILKKPTPKKQAVSKPAPAKPKPRAKKSPALNTNIAGLESADARTRQYIIRFHKVAVAEMKKFGVPASVSLAQGLVESQAGQSKLARNNNNHFGMKCFAKNCKKGHCSNHYDDSHKDFFRVYNNAWESWRAHSKMISSGRYSGLKKYGKDYKKWAYGLKRLGYATDKKYAETLIRVIKRYKLYQFDQW